MTVFDTIKNFLKKMNKNDSAKGNNNSKEAAKERLHLVLMQDRANVSADFLELMKQEIIEVIKKYIDVDESAIDVRLTNRENEDGTNGAPALYANIPIVNIKNEAKKIANKEVEKKEEKSEKEDSNKEKTNNKDIDKEESSNKENDKKENLKEEKQEEKPKKESDKVEKEDKETINEKEKDKEKNEEKQEDKKEG